jgi:transposase
MERRQDYSPEFREEAVKLVTEQGLSRGDAARRLGIPKGTLTNWVAVSHGKATDRVAGSRAVSELEQENRQLRKELAEARLERDILKKATAYFARESLPGTRS